MRIIPLGGLFLVGVLLTGCASMTDGISLAGSEGGSAKLQQQSSALGQRIGLELKQLRRQNERLELAIRVKSNIAYDQSLQYKVDWFDEGGMPVEPERAYWQPLIVHGREEKVLRASAPLSEATSFSFAIREIVKD